MENELFEKEKISTAYFSLSIPLVLSLVVTLIYNLADTFFVAQTGDTSLVAGVSLGAPVFMLLMAFGNIFGQGGSSMISRLPGQFLLLLCSMDRRACSGRHLAGF